MWRWPATSLGSSYDAHITTADETPTEKTLTLGQRWALGAATVPMVGFGGLGAWGTYTNIKAIFPEQATALGVVAAGEGATLVLALVYVGLTLLGQTAPAAVRLGLWMLPALASATGAIVAPTTTDAVVYAVTPLAMCVSAEGMGLLARRIVIHRTGVDMEVQRRNAATLQQLAYHRARSAGHPWGWTRKWSALTSWRIARRVGVGDAQLGTGLVVVQRERMTAGADAALADMFTPAVTPAHALASAVRPALAGSVTPALPAGAGRDGTVTGPVTDAPAHYTAVTDGTQAVTGAVTQVSTETAQQASRPPTETVTPAVTASATRDGNRRGFCDILAGESSRTHGSAVTVGGDRGGCGCAHACAG